MFDFGIGSTELMVILVVAIIVVGPKDLPRLIRTIASVVGKVRSLAREFQGHLDEAMRETGIDEIKENVSKVKEFSVADLDKEFEDLEKEFRDTAMPDDDKPGNETLFAAGDDSGKAQEGKAAEEAEAPQVASPDEDKAAEKPKGGRKGGRKSGRKGAKSKKGGA